MSEVEYPSTAVQVSETNPAMAPGPEQTGAGAWSGRSVRSIGVPESGQHHHLADRLAEPLHARQAGEAPPGRPASNREEETTARDTPLGGRQVRPFGWPKNMELHKLTPEALARLATDPRSPTRIRETPLHDLRHEDVLHNLPAEVRREFLGERAAAWNLAEELTLDDDTTAAISRQVLHDDIPVELVAPLANAHVRLKEQLDELGNAQSGPELETAMRAIRDAMAQAFDDAGQQLTSDNRHRAFKMFWRVVLAPVPEEQAQGIVEQLNRAGSPLRSLGEGAAWYRNECRRQQTAPQSAGTGQRPHPAAQQTPRTAQQPSRTPRQPSASPGPRPVGTPTFSRQSIEAATDYSLMMRSLAEVLHEKTGRPTIAPADAGTADVPDRTIAALRNLGVPMPAPRRLGRQNPDTPVSESGIAAICRQLDEHLQIASRGSFVQGVSAECLRDIQNNNYVIGNRQVPGDFDSVKREIAAFCSNPDGHLNPNLLRNLSMLAYRGGIDCVRRTCLNNSRPDIALFSEDPVLTEVQQVHRLWRDESGNVILESWRVGHVKQVRRQDANGGAETVDLDPRRSILDLRVRFGFDGVTGQPSFQGVSIGYALVPAAQTPALAAATDETASAR